MQMLIVNGVDITPFIAFKGYKFQMEDLDASAERSMSGTLTRDRVARVPTIDVIIIGMLQQAQVTQITNACKPAKVTVNFRNTETGNMQTSDFYVKITHPAIYSTRKGYVEYESFNLSFKGYRGI